MYVSYDRYRIFYYVAKYGNISQAAKVLLNNQPNLTRTIKNLEGELGCTLFARTSRGMKLTPEGQRLYDHIRIAVEHIEAALRCLLLPILKKYRLLHPGIHIRISNYSTPQAIAALKDGTADIAVVTTPTAHSASLVETKVKTVTEVAVCSPFFSALTGRPVSLEELLNYPLISLGTDTKSFEFYSEIFTSHGLPYQPDIEAFTADQILPMVEADLGVGFVPKDFLRGDSAVCQIELKEKIPERSVVLIQRKEQPLSVAAKELKRMILEAEREQN